jgi:hypothetical protein
MRNQAARVNISFNIVSELQYLKVVFFWLKTEKQKGQNKNI